MENNELNSSSETEAELVPVPSTKNEEVPETTTNEEVSVANANEEPEDVPKIKLYKGISGSQIPKSTNVITAPLFTGPGSSEEEDDSDFDYMEYVSGKPTPKSNQIGTGNDLQQDSNDKAVAGTGTRSILKSKSIDNNNTVGNENNNNNVITTQPKLSSSAVYKTTTMPIDDLDGSGSKDTGTQAYMKYKMSPTVARQMQPSYDNRREQSGCCLADLCGLCCGS